MSAGNTARPEWVPEEVDPGRPAAARMYDYLLGGSHNLPADRHLVERALAARPDLAALARANRAFLRRAVRFVAGRGLRQFLDLGSGIPTEGNVHEILREAAPRSRVVYVDVDPVAVAHARVLLAGERRVAVVEGDLRRPREVLDGPVGEGLLDLSEPVAVLLVSVLQFVTDTDDPWAVLSRLRETVPSGSHLVLAHPVLTGRSAPDDALLEVYRRRRHAGRTARRRRGPAVLRRLAARRAGPGAGRGLAAGAGRGAGSRAGGRGAGPGVLRRRRGEGLTPVPARDWSGPQPDEGHGKARLVREWARAVAPYAATTLPRAEIELHLRGHLETLHDALLAEPVDRDRAVALGAALVELRLSRPEALEATVVVLADRLLADLGLDGMTFAGPLNRVLGALAAGYAGALAAARAPDVPGTESGSGGDR